MASDNDNDNDSDDNGNDNDSDNNDNDNDDSDSDNQWRTTNFCVALDACTEQWIHSYKQQLAVGY